MEAAIQAPGPSLRDMRYFFGRVGRGLGASFCNVSEGNVKQWRRPSKHQVRPSGKIAQSSHRWGMGAHAHAMTNMKLPTAATTATMLHTASFDSARHNVVTV